MINCDGRKHYKEITPDSTVKRLQSILAELGIEVQENWMPKSSVGTYSLRVCVKGAQFGTNGKGVSESLARASAYAEFFERFQNDIIDLSCILGASDSTYEFRHSLDARIVSAKEVASLQSQFMDLFYKEMGLENASITEKIMFLNSNERSEYHFHNETSGYELKPYYNVTKNKIEELPYSIYTSYYGSNGMCAGNSPEEAMCQGLSEILERYVQTKMMQEHLSFPDVPESVMKRFPHVYTMYQKATAIEGYSVKMKDCSMNGRYPVAALVVCEKNTGKWGVKFGAHPDFGIAMERTITETTQGVDIQKYASNSIFNFHNNKVDDMINIYNSFKAGIARYPYQLLSNKSDFEPWDPEDISYMSNKEILHHMIQGIEKAGFEILVRDVSYTGFPSYHIIVPGMSEICHFDSLRLRACNTRAYLIKYLNDPEKIDKKIAKYLSGVLEFFSDSQIETGLRFLFSYARNAKELPAENIGLGWLYLDAMCYVYLENYNAAEHCMMKLIQQAEIIKSFPEFNGQDLQKDVDFFYGVMYYCQAMSEMQDHRAVMDYISIICSKEIEDRIEDIFADVKQVFVKQYPKHDIHDENHRYGQVNCCDYPLVLKCRQVLKGLQVKNPIKQDHLQSFFNEIRRY